ncbi:MAG: FadR/GntR family transcriptional regulator [Acidimicrobiales bacterium]|jgi:DNA-binding FadR family transcriptional regulator
MRQVREQLLAAIERGDYPPGSMLPSERQLCEAFGVSRVSVREAISGLEAVGLVRVQHGRGVFVGSPASSLSTGSFAKYFEAHRDELLELLKVRGALDELAAEEAALHHNDEALARMVEANEAFQRATEGQDQDFERLATLDVAFHLSIADCSGGQLLPTLLAKLNGMLGESRRLTLASRPRALRSAKEHQRIVDAICAGDASAARRAAARHMGAIRELLVKLRNGPSGNGSGST